jgi:hypothetical protein
MTRKTAAFTKSVSFAGSFKNSAANERLPPLTTPGNIRAFDARPRPKGPERRSETVRPSYHLDRNASDPLDGKAQ